jgi:hypothetical protein
MGEERNLGAARAVEALSDDEQVKAHLQRQMEETRESISQTVHEIRDTVANQYNHVRETFTEALDWREQFKKRPVAWSVGALSAGVVVGYGLGGIAFGDDRYDYRSRMHERSLGGHIEHDSPYAGAAVEPASRVSYSSGYVAEEPEGPGFIDRVTSTDAYHRLESEVSNLGSKFVDQLATIGQEVLLPAVMAKLMGLLGVDQPKPKDTNTSGYRYESAQASGNVVS